MEFLPVFIEKVHRIFGDKGRQWLPGLPDLIARCREKWGLREGSMCPNMSMNYIEFATTADGESVALKVGVPHAELFTEMEALRLYGGRRAARLLDADCALGAILMQRLQPGAMLWQLEDDREATRIAASLMRDLPVPVPAVHELPSFAQWVERAFRLTRTEWDPQERMPRDLLGRAEEAFARIARSGEEEAVLHGDLHHENILFDARLGWTAIDPKGVIGVPCLEVGRFLQNQLPDDLPAESRAEMVRQRVRILSDGLGYAPEMLAASGLVDCVLSHCWCFEDDGIGPGWRQGIDLGRVLCRLMETGERRGARRLSADRAIGRGHIFDAEFPDLPLSARVGKMPCCSSRQGNCCR